MPPRWRPTTPRTWSSAPCARCTVPSPVGSTGSTTGINGGGPTVGHRLHDGISKVVYGGIRAGFRAGSTGLRAASRAGLGADIEATSRGRFVRAAVTGLIGDRLRDEGSNFHFDMGVRVDGRDVVLDRDRARCGVPRRDRHGSSSSCTASARTRPTGTAPPGPRTEARRESAGQAQLRRAARGARAGRRSTCGSTPACRSRRTASRWRPCWTVWCRPGRSTYAASRSWATRWAA